MRKTDYCCAVAIMVSLCSCAKPDATEILTRSAERNGTELESLKPLTPKYVDKNAPSLIGKKILIDGYIGNICERLAKNGCLNKPGKRRYVLFGNPVLPSTAADQPCSSRGGPEVLLEGYLPASLGKPEGKRPAALHRAARDIDMVGIDSGFGMQFGELFLRSGKTGFFGNRETIDVEGVSFDVVAIAQSERVLLRACDLGVVDTVVASMPRTAGWS